MPARSGAGAGSSPRRADEPRDADADEDGGGDADGDDADESAAAKRIRLAKRYLSRLESEAAAVGEVDAAEIDRENIATRLRTDAVCARGRARRPSR